MTSQHSERPFLPFLAHYILIQLHPLLPPITVWAGTALTARKKIFPGGAGCGDPRTCPIVTSLSPPLAIFVHERPFSASCFPYSATQILFCIKFYFLEDDVLLLPNSGENGKEESRLNHGLTLFHSISLPLKTSVVCRHLARRIISYTHRGFEQMEAKGRPPMQGEDKLGLDEVLKAANKTELKCARLISP